MATNYDAALVSVLCEAQNPAPPERYTSRCPLRNNFKAEITAPNSAAAQYAAAVALVMASTKIQDHVEDKETFLHHISIFPSFHNTQKLLYFSLTVLHKPPIS